MEAAFDAAGVLTDLRSRLGVASSVRVAPDAATVDLWRRVTGAPIEAVDPAPLLRACADLARREHVRSDAARACRERVAPRRTLDLLTPGVPGDFYDDAVGEVSVACFRDAARAVAARPDDVAARVRLAGMQALTDDPAAALATLRGAPRDDVDVRLARAVAAWLAGDEATGRPEFEGLARERGDARAAFDLAEVEHHAAQEAQPPTALRRGVLVRIAAYRVFLCGAASVTALPRAARRTAVERAHAALAHIELPDNAQGPCPRRSLLPFAELPPEATAQCAGFLEDRATPCARARAALDEAFIDRPTVPPPAPAALRALTPAVTAVTGPRPVFAWHGDATALWQRCADRRCERVVEEARVTSPFRPARPLPAGLWHWRVRRDASASPVRTLWVDPLARGQRVVPDVNGDGWPDVPLGPLGVYARFDGPAAPTLTALFAGDGRHAAAAYAGDLDGDGFGDFIQPTSVGTTALLGSPGGLRAPAWLRGGDFWQSVAPFLDLDGDGLTELHLHRFGRVRYASGRTAWFPHDGSSVMTAAGDVDGDGFDDFVTGDYDGSTYAGRWTWRRVTAGGPDPRPFRTFEVASFSERIFPVGDLDGDGRDDLVLPHHVPLAPSPRMTFEVLPSRAARQPVAFEAPGRDAQLWPAGDVDGDGHGDVIVWLEGGLSLRFGGPMGLSPRARPLGVTDVGFGHLVVVQPGVEAAPTPCWVFLDRPTRAIRVTAAAEQTMLLDAP